jgi:ABC-type transport system involved in cytochrome c biogenesis permease subunit
MSIISFVDIFVIVIPFMYLIAVTLYGVTFFRQSLRVGVWSTRWLVLTIAAHLVYIVVRTIAFDHPPITTIFEVMTLMAFCIAIGYAYIEHQTGTRTSGFFILLFSLLLQIASSIFIKDLLEISPVLRSRLLGFHVATALLGYTAISLSAVYGMLYLLMYHEIKSSRFGLMYSRLPNLEVLESMSHKAEVLGFWSLTVAIAIGAIWLPRAFTTFSYLDPKLIGTMLVWILYAIGLTAKWKLGWQGRKTIVISLIAFCITFLSFTVINMYLSGFHTFF